MILLEEQLLSFTKGDGIISLKGTRHDESPHFKWEWFSDPLDCSPNVRCKPESMVGTMNHMEENPRLVNVGRKSAKCF